MNELVREQFRVYLANCVQTRRQTGKSFIIGKTTVDSYVSFAEVDKLFDYAPEQWKHISSIYDIQTDYWYIYTNHNYFIYRIETKKIIIVQMFHEHEDFMLTLFNVSGRTQESIDYWGE